MIIRRNKKIFYTYKSLFFNSLEHGDDNRAPCSLYNGESSVYGSIWYNENNRISKRLRKINKRRIKDLADV